MRAYDPYRWSRGDAQEQKEHDEGCERQGSLERMEKMGMTLKTFAQLDATGRRRVPTGATVPASLGESFDDLLRHS
jgi:hypothetical protein